MRHILCAAIYFPDGKQHTHQPKNIESGFVVTGRRHHNCFATLTAVMGEDWTKQIPEAYREHTQGFITSDDYYVERKEALEIALAAEQVLDVNNVRAHRLFSEDLY